MLQHRTQARPSQAHAKLPAFKKAEAERLAFQAILDTQNERHEAETERLAAMKPGARITHARAMGATSKIRSGSQTKRDLTPEETAAAVVQIEKSGLRGAARMGLARRLGLSAIPDAVVRDVRPALIKGAEEVAATMRALVPVDEGDLDASITVTEPGQTTPAYAEGGGKRTAGSNQALVTAGNEKVRHGHLHEFGTIKQEA